MIKRIIACNKYKAVVCLCKTLENYASHSNLLANPSVCINVCVHACVPK